MFVKLYSPSIVSNENSAGDVVNMYDRFDENVRQNKNLKKMKYYRKIDFVLQYSYIRLILKLMF